MIKNEREALIIVIVIVAVLVLIGLAMALKIVKQYEKGVLFRLGRVRGLRSPGLRVIIPFIDVLHRCSPRPTSSPCTSRLPRPPATSSTSSGSPR